MPFSKFLFLGCFFPPSPCFVGFFPPFLYISNYKTRSFYFSSRRDVQSKPSVDDSVGGTPPSRSALRRWQPWHHQRDFAFREVPPLPSGGKRPPRAPALTHHPTAKKNPIKGVNLNATAHFRRENSPRSSLQSRPGFHSVVVAFPRRSWGENHPLSVGVERLPLRSVCARGQLRGLFRFLRNVFEFLEKGSAADMQNLITLI